VTAEKGPDTFILPLNQAIETSVLGDGKRCAVVSIISGLESPAPAFPARKSNNPAQLHV
jgi:hypothetical protein